MFLIDVLAFFCKDFEKQTLSILVVHKIMRLTLTFISWSTMNESIFYLVFPLLMNLRNAKEKYKLSAILYNKKK